MWKVLAEAGCDPDRAEILGAPGNVGLGGGNLFQAVGPALDELLACQSGWADWAHRDGAYRGCR